MKVKGLEKAFKARGDKIKGEKKVKKVVREEKKAPAKSVQRSKPERGVIYVGHIPHGFYEDQLKGFFSQFGRVTRVRLVRSKKTGRSRGYGYVEMANPFVAEQAAKTMNNHLIVGRVLKANCIPLEKQRLALFYGDDWTERDFPGLTKRRQEVEKNHTSVPESEIRVKAQKSLKRLRSLTKKLKSKGIKLNLEPVNVPQHA